MAGAGWTKIESWWSGRYGWSQRRIWLHTNGEQWMVEAREGDGDAKVWRRIFNSEHDARQLTADMRARTGDDWKQLPVS